MSGDSIEIEDRMKKLLEWEFSLDTKDLRSHGWYHGAITRSKTEEVLKNEGEFLVRDCSSHPNNYVLSCRTATNCLHFVINKVVLQRNTVYERYQYQFEDDAYDTIADLITYYVGSGRPITITSGAKINTPNNRVMPLTYFEESIYAKTGSIGSNEFDSYVTARKMSSPAQEINLLDYQKNKFKGSERCGSLQSSTDSSDYSTNFRKLSVQRSFTMEGFNENRGVVIQNRKYMPNKLSRHFLAQMDVESTQEYLENLNLTEIEVPSKFKVDNFTSLLLPTTENKPLDEDALHNIRELVLRSAPKLLAEHLTRIDINLLFQEYTIDENDENNVLAACGLELLTLPHGFGLRQDIIDRAQCIKILVAVTVLTCEETPLKAEMLSKWIEIASDTKNALGNLYGFCSIMLGLCMPQIQKLNECWQVLRQKFTETAYTFDAKLKPTFNFINDCTSPQPPNISVPQILIYSILKDRKIEDCLNTSPIANTKNATILSTCISPWETNADDFGLLTTFNHLNSARDFLKNFDIYKNNSRSVLKDSSPRYDDVLNEIFSTEFHMKFLWGSHGALSSAETRHVMFENVLEAMSDKFNANTTN